MNIHDSFIGSVNPHWIQTCTGGGTLQIINSTLRMAFESASADQYTDVQIDDYNMIPRSAFPWKPPLRMTVRARSSLPAATSESTNKSTKILRGTAGFGFWNNPFSIRGDVYTLPEAVWFFYSSPPSNIKLVPNIPGWGWKSQIVHTKRFGALAHVAPMLLATVFGKVSGEIRPASHLMQRLAGAQEALLTVDMTKWHTYILEWLHDKALFWVDGKLVLCAQQPPTSPLGFVAWLDNQYAIATPNNILRFGKVSSNSQWLDMSSIKIESL